MWWAWMVVGCLVLLACSVSEPPAYDRALQAFAALPPAEQADLCRRFAEDRIQVALDVRDASGSNEQVQAVMQVLMRNCGQPVLTTEPFLITSTTFGS